MSALCVRGMEWSRHIFVASVAPSTGHLVLLHAGDTQEVAGENRSAMSFLSAGVGLREGQ